MPALPAGELGAGAGLAGRVTVKQVSESVFGDAITHRAVQSGGLGLIARQVLPCPLGEAACCVHRLQLKQLLTPVGGQHCQGDTPATRCRSAQIKPVARRAASAAAASAAAIVSSRACPVAPCSPSAIRAPLSSASLLMPIGSPRSSAIRPTAAHRARSPVLPTGAQAGPRRPDQRIQQSSLVNVKRQFSAHARVLAQHRLSCEAFTGRRYAGPRPGLLSAGFSVQALTAGPLRSQIVDGRSLGRP
jgi:hypothetical protein